jgi:hypothetical protein
MTARRKHDDPAAISARLRKTFAEVNHNVKARKAALANGTALVPKPKVDPATGPLCGCGCKERTRGGRFKMGHDARYLMPIVRAVRAGDRKLAELKAEDRPRVKSYLAAYKEMMK